MIYPHLVVKESTSSIPDNKKHMRVKYCFKIETNSGIGKDLLSVSNGKLNLQYNHQNSISLYRVPKLSPQFERKEARLSSLCILLIMSS